MTAASVDESTALPPPQVHPSAIVHPQAVLAAGVVVGPGCVIEDGVELGAGTRLGTQVIVHRGVRVGARNRVFAHAVLGGEAQVMGIDESIESFVVIGDDNTLREAVTVQRGFKPGGVTRIGNGNYLMVNTHIAHDCTLGNQVIMANNSTLAGHVSIDDRAFISGHVAIHQFARVGRLAMVAGLAKVVQDCLPFVITDGNPARARGLNVVGMKRAGFSSEAIRALRRAYRALLREGRKLESALAILEADEQAAVRELATFIRGSQRGFAHEPTRGRRSEEE
jgi:UDP-N-acetylglucosamine acyltransferase